MSNIIEKAKDLVSSPKEPTSASLQEEEIPKYGSGNIVPASDGFYDAGPGAEGGKTTAPKEGSTHKGDNYDMKNVTGSSEGREALEGESTGAGVAGGSTKGISNEGLSEKSSSGGSTSGKTSTDGLTGSSTSGGDVFATDPTSASGISTSGSTSYETTSANLGSTGTSTEGVSSEGAGDGTLRGALRGESTSTKAEYGA